MTIKDKKGREVEERRRGGSPRRRKKHSPMRNFMERNRHLFPHYDARTMKPQGNDNGIPSHIRIRAVAGMKKYA